MSETVNYCATGCTTVVDGKKLRVFAEDRSQLCRHCEGNLHKWLTKIPDLYALLPTFAIPGSAEKNPDSKATKRAEVAAPVRLEVLDLLDTRLGRKWLGTAAAHDRRGVVGALLVHAERLVEERPLTTELKDRPTVVGLCALLDRHRLWLAEQDWVTFILDDLKQIHRELSDAIGEYRRPPIGHCHIENEEGKCGGPLFANPLGGVRCARCQATWDPEHLRQLGLAQALEAG